MKKEEKPLATNSLLLNKILISIIEKLLYDYKVLLLERCTKPLLLYLLNHAREG